MVKIAQLAIPKERLNEEFKGLEKILLLYHKVKLVHLLEQKKLVEMVLAGSWNEKIKSITFKEYSVPTYQYVCNKCNHGFDEFMKMEDREIPTTKACPSCKKKKSVVRDYNSFSQSIGSDATVTPNKVTGGKWNEMMGRMKKGLAKRYHKNLDSASSNTGRYWSG